MKTRLAAGAAKVEPQMAPMIDIVFQLLVFFVLTLRIVEPEGDLTVHMPPPGSIVDFEPHHELSINVRLESNADGTLSALRLGQRSLGNDEQAFDRLNAEILKLIGRPGNPLAKDIEVEIDSDYGLHYQYVVRAVGACTGRWDPQSKSVVRYVEKIRFAPPRRSEDAA